MKQYYFIFFLIFQIFKFLGITPFRFDIKENKFAKSFEISTFAKIQLTCFSIIFVFAFIEFIKPAINLNIFFIYVIIFILFLISFLVQFWRQFFKINELVEIFNDTLQVCRDVQIFVNDIDYEKRIVIGVLKIVIVNFIVMPLIYSIQNMMNLNYYVISSYEKGGYDYAFIMFVYFWLNLNICVAFIINWIFGNNVVCFTQKLKEINCDNILKKSDNELESKFNTIDEISVIYARQLVIIKRINRFFSAELMLIMMGYLINFVWISFTFVVLLIYIVILHYPLDLKQMISYFWNAIFYFLQVAIISNIYQNVLNKHQSYALYLSEMLVKKNFNHKLTQRVKRV